MPDAVKLRIVPTDLKTANEFVRRLHRHSRPVVGYKFAVGVEDETGTLRGVAIVGRPVAPRLDDGLADCTLRGWQQWEAGDRRMHPAFWELFRIKVDAH